MVSNSSSACADGNLANPVLLDLIDREMKSEFNVVLGTKEITSASRSRCSPPRPRHPADPRWTLPYTGTRLRLGGPAAYIVTKT